jgi:TPR repeat protein
MKRVAWIIVLMWAASGVAQVSGFRPVSKPELSKLMSKAREGNTESQLRLGTAYEYGLGVERDSRAAEYWLKTAAGFGDPEAQTQLGLLYLQPGFEAEREQAARWFLRASVNGYPNAEHDLGLVYLMGLGVRADREQAIHWFRRGAQHGSKAARANLGILLVDSKSEAEQKEGFELLAAAAKDSNPDAENALAYAYQFGAGTSIDIPKAIKWFKRAASHGNLNAMANLANIYMTGAGQERNIGHAVRLYTEACDAGHRRSCIALANAYLRGDGVKRDEAKAYRLGLMADADEKTIAALEKELPEVTRNHAAEEAERWKQAHAVQLSTSPR